VKRVSLSRIRLDFWRYLQIAEEEPVLVTRYGHPAGVVVGFATEKDWIRWRDANDPTWAPKARKGRKARAK
jgi:PHD/YefM family antitoxin component YafN of YafNO toxin-antitoxin module